MCRRQIINAGIKKIVIRDTPTEYRVVDVQKEWVEVDDSLPADN
jgi:dCMP deaminase